MVGIPRKMHQKLRNLSIRLPRNVSFGLHSTVKMLKGTTFLEPSIKVFNAFLMVLEELNNLSTTLSNGSHQCIWQVPDRFSFVSNFCL